MDSDPTMIIGSAGRRLYLIDWFREAFADLGLEGRVVVTSLLILLTTLLQSIPSNYYQRIFFLTGKHKTKTK